ncbi:helix-turn-helix domain-containing protein [Tenacibaculum sp. 190524A05c]|uniref:helix-turn-helix domain-containing protein n=1 Tax=Tenacibaculum platacis TaxID=3137852 RepID=UPI0031FA51A6
MNIKVITPSSKLLQKHIYFYYILEETQKDEVTSYLTFPNQYNMVSFSHGVEIDYQKDKISVTPSKSQEIIGDVIFRYKNPILINYEGICKEITIAFKPLGVYSFFDSFSTIDKNGVCYKLIDYDKDLMSSILEEENYESITSRLESYLLSINKEFKHPFLHHFANDVLNGVEYSNSYYTDMFGISSKTFIKHCKQYLKRTPNEFKKVARFKRTLDEFGSNQKGLYSLTDLCYSNSFFDQAHMIKDFKSLTGYTPKDFFKKLSLDNKGINWVYL